MIFVYIITGLFVAGALWLWWEAAHAPDGYETEHGYGPVSAEHAGLPDVPEAIVFDWPKDPDDRSEVRHGGLGR